MIKQSQAHIYLADARKQRKTSGYHCWSTLNTENYKEKDLGSLFLFNYQIVATNQKTNIVTHANCLYYFLPLYGGISIRSNQSETIICTQQSQQIFSKNEGQIEFSNPFQENVSFLLIGFQTKSLSFGDQLVDFDISNKNKLVTLFENKITRFSIGQFDGRYESEYQFKNKQNGIFTYIIQGAFEFENRLLETGDALSIKNIEAVEWEALSENAMLLLIEIPLE